MSIRIKQLRVQAFRAYPTSKAFSFPEQTGGSILIFAPNGHGKSSITDAFEFLLHPESTLERLGQRNSEVNSGRKPLRNTMSRAQLPTLVELKLVDSDGMQKTGVREAKESATPIPVELDHLNNAAAVDFIIRGPDLREFIYKTTPRERYNDLANYIDAERLSKLQADIRAVETQLRKDSESHLSERRSLQQQLRSLTGNAVLDWNESDALQWLREMLAPYALAPSSVDIGDPIVARLQEREANERSSLVQRQHQVQIDRINPLLRRDERGAPLIIAPLRELESARDVHNAAARTAAQAASRHVIDSAISLLSDTSTRVESWAGSSFVDT